MSNLMIELEIDGKSIAVPRGTKIIDAIKLVNSYVPHFCYHKKLTVAANCRMCLVEVEKIPKVVPACATDVSAGMVIKTKSDKVLSAQKSVMEFLLINHPLDCPICDQAGECQLQDLSVGYGKSFSRYHEDKRVVMKKEAGPLISMNEMSRCILCTRCVRFGREVAGLMELGVVGRGEHAEITSFINKSLSSELSGNVIDICPVGALTSKPFRFTARSWELKQYRYISPHDSLGTNLIIQTKNDKVMRVLPFENEAINECWISDRDRFSYESLSSIERLTDPMIKEGGVWKIIDWPNALEYVAKKLKTFCLNNEQNTISNNENEIAFLASQNSTLEELFLTQQLANSIKAEYQFRLRQQDMDPTIGAPWLGMSIAELAEIDTFFIIGANLCNDQPLIASRLRRYANRNNVKIILLNSTDDNALIPTSKRIVVPPDQWLNIFSKINSHISSNNLSAFDLHGLDKNFSFLLQSLKNSKRASILLGNAFVNHPNFSLLYQEISVLSSISNIKIGFLGESANTVGAHLLNQHQKKENRFLPRDFFKKEKRAYVLIGNEPEFDCGNPRQALSCLKKAEFVVSLTAFKPIGLILEAIKSSWNKKSSSQAEDLLELSNKYGSASNTYSSLLQKAGDSFIDLSANENYADILLPIAPFAETPGSLINMEGKVQTFKNVSPPVGNSRPAWKILRAIGALLDKDSFKYDTNDEVSKAALRTISLPDDLNNKERRIKAEHEIYRLNISKGSIPYSLCLQRIADIPIYHSDPIVRRAFSLQITDLAKQAHIASLSIEDYTKLNLSCIKKVRIWQDDCFTEVFTISDATLPKGIIRLNNCTSAASKLGSVPAMVIVEPVQEGK